jgi:Fe-S-cluster containining protein
VIFGGDSGEEGKKAFGKPPGSQWSLDGHLLRIMNPDRESMLADSPLIFRDFCRDDSDSPTLIELVNGIALRMSEIFIQLKIAEDKGCFDWCAKCGACCGPAPATAHEVAFILAYLLSSGRISEAVRNSSKALIAGEMAYSNSLMPPCHLLGSSGCLAYPCRPLACRTAGMGRAIPGCGNNHWECHSHLFYSPQSILTGCSDENDSAAVVFPDASSVRRAISGISGIAFSNQLEWIYLNTVDFHFILNWFVSFAGDVQPPDH